MGAQEEFTDWSVAQGVSINGVAIHRFPGSGFGILAGKDFKADDEVLKVPANALHNILKVPKPITAALTASTLPISVNGILALSLALSTTSTPWDAILPTFDEILESIPFNWDPSLQAHLPPGASSLLLKQQKKVAQDFKAASASFPDLKYNDYVYNWFLVGTRTFYYTVPTPKGSKKKKKKPLDHDDCISLAPFADCFNHTSHGTCTVILSANGYVLAATSAIKAGEEISISYGNHSNDFLLAEYGFILSGNENTWDEIPLDSLLLPLFSPKQKDALKEAGFLGKWALDKDGACYRTQVAIRLLVLSKGRWERLVANGLDDGDSSQKDVDAILAKHLKPYLKVIQEHSNRVEGEEAGLESQRETLRRRWAQINELVEGCLQKLEGNKS